MPRNELQVQLDRLWSAIEELHERVSKLEQKKCCKED